MTFSHNKNGGVMEKRFILSIDQGTTSSRAIIFDRELNIVSIGQREFRQYYPQPGWVEHDPDEIWESVKDSISEAISNANISGEEIAAIGITNQRETSFFWDRRDGRPVYNAIVWQCRRSADICDRYIKKGLQRKVREKTGLVLDPYFSATKVVWLLEKDRKVRRLAEDGNLAFGTSDVFVLLRLTSNEVFATDVSNASRTMLYNIHSLKWDEELLRIFRIPASILPAVKSSAGIFGYTKGVSVLPDGIPIAGIGGDQQSALFGQFCFEAGDTKITYGTGAFLLVNTGIRPRASRYGLLTTIAWEIGGKIYYALEGSIFIAGAVVQWLRDGLKIIERSSDVERLASSVEDSGGVVVVPAFVGLGAPHWRKEAKGLIWGITRGTTSGHIARAAVESIALQANDIIIAMEKDLKRRIRVLRVDGGASANDYLLSYQANISQKIVHRPAVIETTARGAAMLASLGSGFIKDLAALKSRLRIEKEFTPSMSSREVKVIRERWDEAIKRV